MVEQKIKEGYKQTEIGIFPDDWIMPKILEFTDATSGGTPSTLIPKYWNGEIEWMNSGELNLKKIYAVEGRITEIGLKNSSTKIIPKNCVLIGLAGQGKTRGTVAINYVELCINQSIGAIYPNESFDSEYLYYNLDSRYKELRNLSSGGEGRGGLNLTIIRNISIPLPPTVDEQSRIKKVLLDFDKIIEYLDKLIEKKQNIKQGTIQELLTGKRNSESKISLGDWNPLVLTNYVSDIRGGAPLKPSDFTRVGFPVLHKGDIKQNGEIVIEDTNPFCDNKFALNHKNNIIDDSFLVVTLRDLVPSGPSIGLIAKSKGEYLLAQGAYGFHIDKSVLDPNFLVEISNSFFYRQLMKSIAVGSTQIHIRTKEFFKIELTIPSLLEQQKISQILLSMNHEIKKLKNLQTKYIKTKQGMMQKLLTGEIRLK